MRLCACTLLGLLALATVARAAGAPIPPAPDRWVTDNAGFLSPERRAQLDQRLEAYEQRTGHQIIVWIGNTISGAPLDDWAVHTFAAWKVGRKKYDDGLVMFILAADRKIDIEVGYGLEGQVPDAIANRVIQDVMAPRLRAGDRDGAVQAGVEAILTAIEGKPVPGLQAKPRAAPDVAPIGGTAQTILFALAAVFFLVLLIVNPRLALFFLWSMGSGGGGYRGQGGGGGGFGGGGGRSGGGGARGGW
jgi:uncharacterized protein